MGKKMERDVIQCKECGCLGLRPVTASIRSKKGYHIIELVR